MNDLCRILEGSVFDTLPTLPDASVQMVATSPPYFGLRSYLPEGHPDKAKEIGTEKTPQEYVEKLVAVFSEVRRVLKDDGLVFLNLGDSYAATHQGELGTAQSSAFNDTGHAYRHEVAIRRVKEGGIPAGLKPKDLLMVPARVAMALQADGWYLRSQIPWIKRQAMPESVEDRPNSAVEYVFLLSKSATYYYDHVAVKVPAQSGPSDIRKMLEKKERIGGKHFVDGPGVLAAANPATNIGKKRGVGGAVANGKYTTALSTRFEHEKCGLEERDGQMLRNWRNSDAFIDTFRGLIESENGDPLAFLVNPQPYREAHFATWPPRLVLPMILAGSRTGDVVLDPFFGSGTTGMAAIENGRRVIGCELNPAYCALARQRCTTTAGLPL